MKYLCMILFLGLILGGSPCFSQGTDETREILIPKGNGVYLNLRTGEMVIRTDEISPPGPRERKADNPGVTSGKPETRPRRAERNSTDLETGDVNMYMGNERINLNTGERRIDLGGGDAIDTETGDRIIYSGDGEEINTNTGQRKIKIE